MVDQASFSERQGYVRPREIVFRDELPDQWRSPIVGILQSSVRPQFLQERVLQLFNPYGVENWPNSDTPAEDVLMTCDWFRLYDLIEDIFRHLEFHDPFGRRSTRFNAN